MRVQYHRLLACERLRCLPRGLLVDPVCPKPICAQVLMTFCQRWSDWIANCSAPSLAGTLVNSNIPAMTHVIADLASFVTSVLILGTHLGFHSGHEYLTGHIST